MKTAGFKNSGNKASGKKWLLTFSTIALFGFYCSSSGNIKSAILTGTSILTIQQEVTKGGLSGVSSQISDPSNSLTKNTEDSQNDILKSDSRVSQTLVKSLYNKDTLFADSIRDSSVKKPVATIKYSVKKEEMPDGFSLTLDRQQLWKTDWYQTLTDINPTLAVRDGKIIGVTLNNIKESSLLAAVGIQEQDTIMQINGADLNNPFTMPEVIARGIGAAKTNLVIEREGKPIKMDIKSDHANMSNIPEEEQSRVINEYLEFTSATQELSNLTKDEENNHKKAKGKDSRIRKTNQSQAENPVTDALFSYSMSLMKDAKGLTN